MIKKTVEKKHRNKKYPDRIYRGRILKIVRESVGGAVIAGLGRKIDEGFEPKLDGAWLEKIINRLCAEGFVVRNRGKLKLK